ncbi:MAG TPA: glycosyltransferase family 2 protein [Candidatus Saccharimonadales bacterium]|nr:glycosyltransferase family 2 protein [Candidatus Saccharimonadales bacterium]
MATSGSKVVVVVPNWNGEDRLKTCLDSLLAQSLKTHIIVVDNASTDGSRDLLKKYPDIEVIKHSVNKGYAGGVNAGFKRALEMSATYVAAFNNDAVADKDWLKNLVSYHDAHSKVGIAASKVIDEKGKHIDSTGDQYTVWGLPYPRGRGESEIDKYDSETEIFGASGAASLYRASMLEEIGLLDEDFFAYYEDVDLSFRAQLAGYKVIYVPESEVHHSIGATSQKIKGFTTYQTMKNLQLLMYKNVPRKHMYKVCWRFTLASSLFLLRAISRGQGWPAIKGDLKGSYLLLKKHSARKQIQGSRKVSDEYIWSVMTHDLPPNAKALRSLRAKWWKVTGKKAK